MCRDKVHLFSVPVFEEILFQEAKIKKQRYQIFDRFTSKQKGGVFARRKRIISHATDCTKS